MKNIESGRSMIEMLGVLAIIGVLSVGGIAGYSRAMTKYRTNKTIDQVVMLVSNIRTLYAQQNNFQDLSNKIAYDLGVVPDDLVPVNFKNDESHSLLRNAFKGAVYIHAVEAYSGGEAATAFEITFDGLSREACIAIATSDWGSGSDSGLINVTFRHTSSTASLGSPTNNNELGVYKYIGCTGAKDIGRIVACPGGEIHLPLTVSDASNACNCTGTLANHCSISWRYF